MKGIKNWGTGRISSPIKTTNISANPAEIGTHWFGCHTTSAILKWSWTFGLPYFNPYKIFLNEKLYWNPVELQRPVYHPEICQILGGCNYEAALKIAKDSVTIWHISSWINPCTDK